jgi:hypothetical protein
MVATVAATIRQTGPGAPVDITGYVTSLNGADFSGWSSFGVGATAGLTAPVTFADLTHYDAMGNTAFSDSVTDTYTSTQAPGNVPQLLTDRAVAKSLQRATGNYAVGKHLWMVLFATGSPSGTDAVLAASGPYTVV